MKTVTATGTVNPELTIMVGSYVSGVIQDLSCDYNTRVKKGQLCAKIDPRPYQTVVDQDVANVDAANAQLAKDKASLAYAKLTFDRDHDLLQSGVISQDVFDSAQSSYDQLQAQVNVDQSTVAERKAELDTAQVNLSYTDITSPVDGTVVLRNVTMGQTVASSFQTPTLFLIATDLTRMQVDTNVSESDVGHLANNDRVTFTVEAFPSRIFVGKVVQIRQAPQTVQNVVTYDIVVAVSNKDLVLMPGMTATTKIITDQRDNVLRVPDQALRFTPSSVPAKQRPPERGHAAARAALWVLRDGSPQQVWITPGLDDDSYTEILDGDLKAGDQVILSEQAGRTAKSSAHVTTPHL